jgi:hypothetical protein
LQLVRRCFFDGVSKTNLKFIIYTLIKKIKLIV